MLKFSKRQDKSIKALIQWATAPERVHSLKPEESDRSSIPGVLGSCELLSMVLGNGI